MFLKLTTVNKFDSLLVGESWTYYRHALPAFQLAPKKTDAAYVRTGLYKQCKKWTYLAEELLIFLTALKDTDAFTLSWLRH